jgi:hypothetical protein
MYNTGGIDDWGRLKVQSKCIGNVYIYIIYIYMHCACIVLFKWVTVYIILVQDPPSVLMFVLLVVRFVKMSPFGLFVLD